jgi:multiple sugar transport system substrate-binding protein
MYFKRMTALKLSLSLTLMGGLLIGCSSGGKVAQETEKTTIKVMHYDERSFYSQYGMLFSAIHPEVEIEVISTQSLYNGQNTDMKKAMEDLIAEQKPDVLMLGTEDYRKMAGEGKLYNLEGFIKKDEYDLEGMIPGVVDFIKNESDGILYGLAPNFYSQAIFYNKDMFTKYGVTPPEDKMSWEQLLQLAARFPTDGAKEDRVYGLKAGYNSNLYYFGQMIGSSLGLSYINPASMQMTLNTDAWKSAYETANNAIKSGSLYVEEPNNGMMGDGSYESYLLRDPFISGKVAMTIESNYLMDQIKEAKNVLKDKAIQNWDLVTVPVNPQSPDESSGMSISQIFAIDSQSTNPEAAWKFVSYINGDEFARVTSKVQNGGFPVRSKYLTSEEGLNLSAFYSLKPSQSNMYKDFDKLPQEFFMKFDGLTQQELQGVTDGNLSISEALDNLQTKGQQLLLEENMKAEQKKAEEGTSTEAKPDVAEQSIEGSMSSAASVSK